MDDPRSNRASSVFHSMDDLAQAIIAARTFGMRDLTVTTVYHASSESSNGSYIRSSVDYYLDCAMLGSEADVERQLAHIADARSALESAQAS